MNNLGLVFPVQQTATKVSTPMTWEEFWFNLYQSNPKFWGKQFQKIVKMNLPGIISNPRLAMSQKFEKIFGLRFPSNGRLGDIFSDIGGWFSQTFSQQNLTNWQNQINTTNQTISNFLQLMRNQGNMQSQVQQQQKIQDIQTQAVLTTKSFIETYQMPIIIGLAVLLGVVVLKKK